MPNHTPSNPDPIPLTVIPGDGIGPEVTQAALKLMAAAGGRFAVTEAVAGAVSFAAGDTTGVPEETLRAVERTGLVLKGPLETPVGHGGKSANVTLRKLFETFGNIRPVKEVPGIVTPFSGRGVDMIVVRENVEDLYAGIEHMQTPGVAQCLKLISRKGCEKIARLAFELARSEGRKSVHCATKANIMKLTEGMMKRVFEDVASDYRDIAAHHIIIDNCAQQLVMRPEQFEVIVTTNMNGDILSDLAAGLVGGLGLAPSANIGPDVAIFEAVHGSAPDIAGKGVANPTALALAGAMLMRHVGQGAAAERLERALFAVLGEGASVTPDVARDTSRAAGTDAFAEAVIAAMEAPEVVSIKAGSARPVRLPDMPRAPKLVTAKTAEMVGVDVFVDADTTPGALGGALAAATRDTAFRLKMISNRGTQVYPVAGPAPDCVDHWRCRFVLHSGAAGDDAAILALLSAVAAVAPWMHVEKLMRFDGERAYTLAQGEAA